MLPRPFQALWASPTSHDPSQSGQRPLSIGLEDSLTWYPQGASNAELLDAAGGFMIRSLFAGTMDDQEGTPWMNL